jgi:hypothetical protein
MIAEGNTLHAAQQPWPPIRLAVPSDLSEKLDLAPLLGRVASYTQTRQGMRAILDLVALPPPPPSVSFKGSGG